mgnify:CR=1 FL=1
MKLKEKKYNFIIEFVVFAFILIVLNNYMLVWMKKLNISWKIIEIKGDFKNGI